MAKSIFNLLSKKEKIKIINFYLKPNSYKDTQIKFNLQNRRDLQRILNEFDIKNHSQETINKIRLSKKYVCEICGKSMCISNKIQHLLAHKNNSRNLKLHQSVNHDGLKCIYCEKLCKNKNSLAQHECRCKKNPKRIINCYNNNNNLKNRGWSKGLNKNNDVRLKRISEGLKNHYKNCKGTFNGKKHSEETKQRMREISIKNQTQTHFGSHKSYLYKGIKFVSSYEVIVAKSLDINNIKWEKPEYGIFKYFDSNNKIHTYTPDFYLLDYDIYLDPKNDYLINNVNKTLGYCDIQKIKWVEEQNNVKILILNKNQLNWNEINKLIKKLKEK